MIGVLAYQTYCGLVNHFNVNMAYDGWKYNFKTRVADTTFNAKPFKYQFIKIEKDHPTQKELLMYMAPAFILNGYVNTKNVRQFKSCHDKFVHDLTTLKENYLTSLQRLCNNISHPMDILDYDGQMPVIYNIAIKGGFSDDEIVLFFMVFSQLNSIVGKEPFVYESWKKGILFKKQFYHLYISNEEICDLKVITTTYFKSIQ